MQNAYSNSHSYEYDLCLIHSFHLSFSSKVLFVTRFLFVLFVFLYLSLLSRCNNLCYTIGILLLTQLIYLERLMLSSSSINPGKNALNLRTSYFELLDCLYSLALSLYILIAMIFSVLVTYSNRLCHLHCPSYHAKLKIIVLSTVLDSLTLAQEITVNLQFLILRDPYAHLDGDLQNSATYTLSRKASILENCICQVLHCYISRCCRRTTKA